MKHRELSCTGFSAPFATKLSHATLSANRLALIRSAIALRASYVDLSYHGFFWLAVSGVSKICELLDHNLKPKPDFFVVTSTERAYNCYLLAECLGHWFSQKYLDVDVLLPVEKYGAKLVGMPAFASFPKAMPKGFRRSTKAQLKSAPDYIGLSGDERHVIECKGRSAPQFNGPSSPILVKARNKALHQVCRVSTVDGINPKTRTACVFAFAPKTTAGVVTDPGPIEQQTIRPNYPTMLRQYYSIAFDPLFQNAARPQGEYLAAEFMPGWSFAIHQSVWKAIQSVESERDARRFLALLRGMREHSQGTPAFTEAGPDGFKVTAPRGFDRLERDA